MAGRWGAVLPLGPQGLRIVLTVVSGAPITLTSLDQNNQVFTATGGTCRANGADLQFSVVRARLRVTLGGDGNTLTGNFEQGSQVPVTLTRLQAGQVPERPRPAPFSDLQSEVRAARSSTNAPALGAANAQVKDGRVVLDEAVDGTLLIGEAEAVKTGQIWHVGSITKSMTATLVARLVERGLIAWDMPLADAFGTQAPDMNPAYRPATLAQLMSGRSGMPTNIGMGDFFGHVASDQTPTERRVEWVRQALKMAPENEVGKGYVYPNNGYVLAGALCERLTGKTYETLMAEEVFGPLGLTSAGFGPPKLGNPQGHRKAVLGNRLVPVGVEEGADNPAAMSPAGRAHMTLTDLARFALAHSLGHQGLQTDYLRQETWRFLHTPPPPLEAGPETGNHYAFGWVKQRDGTLWHNGSNTYWYAEAAFNPSKSKAAAACANLAGTEAAVARVLDAGLASEL